MDDRFNVLILPSFYFQSLDFKTVKNVGCRLFSMYSFRTLGSFMGCKMHDDKVTTVGVASSGKTRKLSIDLRLLMGPKERERLCSI